MFKAAIIDVAIRMTLSFLVVSLASSAITEAISSFISLREEDPSVWPAAQRCPSSAGR